MIFTDTNEDKMVLNIPHITRIESVAGGYLVVSFGTSKIIKKDEHSNKLFDFLAAKAAKDILGDNRLENIQSKMTDMLSNLKMPK